MIRNFDLVVVGSGSAGSTAALACRKSGWSVAIVDSRPFGGTCALRGCDPKKVLVGAAELVDWSRRMGAKHVLSGDLRIDWPELIRFKASFTEPVPKQSERTYQEAEIAAFHGRAHFIDRTTLAVNDDRLVASFFLIACGAKHAPLGVPGEAFLTTSTGFLELAQIPPRVVFVGGGYISFEFAHVTVRAGAHAIILHRGPRPLDGFEPDLVDRLVSASVDAGINIRVNAAVQAIERQGNRFLVRASEAGSSRVYEADLVVHGAGRVPEIDDLRLESAGVAYGKHGVEVNEYLQSTSNQSVYAAGDAAASGGLPLTPVAGMEGEIVAANMLGGNRHKPNFSEIPTIVYSIPPLAALGLKETEARERGLRFRVQSADTAEWYSSRRVASAHSCFKVLVEEETDRILGAHVLGPHAEEVINVFALAMRAVIPATQLRETLFAYPTGASDIEHMV
jgi:glutathione reductase (NADPH)